jgi:glycosyltransferase involved in cell wall biosynthesis
MARVRPEPETLSEADELSVLLLTGRMMARGSSAYTLRLAERLGDVDIRAQLVCESADCVPAAARGQIALAEYPHLNVPLWKHFVFRELMDFVRSNPPALVHVQTPASLKLGEQIAASLQVPLVLTVHSFLAPEATLRFRPRLGGKLIVVSEQLRTDLVRRTGVSPHDVRMIHSGVEIPEEEALPAAGMEGRVPVVAAAGPLEKQKGHAYFLRAAKRVLDQGLDVEFLVAGSGPDEAALRRLAHELSIAPHVTFVPYVQRYSEVLGAVDVFCLPSLQQGLGTIMLEAMALGKPVIATNVGGVAAAVRDGQTGLVIPSQNETELAEKIVWLVQNPDRAREIGRRGRELVSESFNVRQMVNETANVYREVLDEPVKLRVLGEDEEE